MPAINSLKDLLIDEVKDLYNAESQLISALPKMAKAATNAQLKEGLEHHLEQTKEHAIRLERVLEILNCPAKGKTCHAMKGLIEEGSEAIGAKGPAAVRDAKLIGAAQRVEHYEIAAYGTARAFAEQLGEEEIVGLLQTTLDEEGEANKQLTLVSSTVNEEALVPDESMLS